MKKNGFTLIEVIATLIIGAIFFAMVFSFFSAPIIKANNPSQNLQNISSLDSVMADITNVYNKFKIWGDNKVYYSKGDIVVPTVSNDCYYECKTAGSRGTSEPSWSTQDSALITDGNITWITHSTKVLEYLINYITTTYPTYISSTPSYTTDFNSADGETVLKVVINKQDSGTVTSYFTKK